MEMMKTGSRMDKLGTTETRGSKMEWPTNDNVYFLRMTFIMASYLLVMVGVLGIDGGSGHILKCGMTMMLFPIMMIIADKLWACNRWDPMNAAIIWILISNTFFFAIFFFILDTFFVGKHCWVEKLRLFFIVVIIPVTFFIFSFRHMLMNIEVYFEESRVEASKFGGPQNHGEPNKSGGSQKSGGAQVSGGPQKYGGSQIAGGSQKSGGPIKVQSASCYGSINKLDLV